MDLYARFINEFTEEDREKCIKTMHRLLEFATMARRKGLLAILSMVNENDDFITKIAVHLIAGGTDPIIVENILSNFILSGNYNSYEKLNACIIMNGFLSIQVGENPRIIQMKIISMLGEQIFNEQLGGLEQIFKSSQEKHNEQLVKLKVDKPEALNESRQFEVLFLNMNDNSIQRVLRGIKNDDVITAFCGCSYRVVEKILNNYSFGFAQYMLTEIILKDVIKQDVMKAQEKILVKIKDLKESAEIILT